MLLHRLRKPDRFTDPAPPPLPEPMSDQEWQGVLNADEADESSMPAIPKSPWRRARTAIRCANSCGAWRPKRLRLATEQWQKAVAAQEAPLSPRSRDLLAFEVSKELELMRREERSCFREFARLIRDLMKLQKESEVRRPKSEGKPQGESEVPGPKPEAADHHPRPPVPSPATHDAVIGETAAVAPAMAAVQAQNTGAEDGTEKNVRKNEGASGYVEENTGKLKSDGATANAQPTTHPAAEAYSLPDNLTEANTATPATVVIGLLPSNIRTAA